MQSSDLSQFSQTITEIRGEDHLIDPTDVLIAAQSMIDIDCVGLLTFDGAMIDSAGLRKIGDRRRKGFIITDNPP